FGARHYASAMGRFMTTDWSQHAAPIPYADVTNPQSFNLYAYVRNNPLRGTDPDGHCERGVDCLEKNFKSGAAMIANAYTTAGKAIVKMATGTVNTLGTGVGEVVGGIASGDSKEIQQGINKIGGTATLLATAALGDAPAAAETSGGLADSAIVVRGGVPTAGQLTKGAESIAEDGTLNGVSVQSANGATVEQLSQGLPNNKVGVT